MITSLVSPNINLVKTSEKYIFFYIGKTQVILSFSINEYIKKTFYLRYYVILFFYNIGKVKGFLKDKNVYTIKIQLTKIKVLFQSIFFFYKSYFILYNIFYTIIIEYVFGLPCMVDIVVLI